MKKIFLGYSKDGLTWEKLNKDENGKAQPILVNDASESDLGVRDPYHPFQRRRQILDLELTFMQKAAEAAEADGIS